MTTLFLYIVLLISGISSLKVRFFTKSFPLRFLKTSHCHSTNGYDFDFEYDSRKINKLDSSKQTEIHNLVENLIADTAINTCAFYNDELQKHGFSSNIVSKTWMLGFLNYKDVGFSISSDNDGVIKVDNHGTVVGSSSTNANGNNNSNTILNWNRYIESMIALGPIDIKVITMPQKGMFPEGSSMRMQYIQKIEPRKIAHKLLQIYESLLKELTTDVATVTREHSEALRYSTLRVKEGKDVADKSRKTVRLNFDDNDENGTPFREKNWHILGALISRIAVELVTADYLSKAGSNDNNQITYQQDHKGHSNDDDDDDGNSAVVTVTDEATATAYYLHQCILDITNSGSSAASVTITKSKADTEFDRQFTRRLLESLYAVCLQDGIVNVAATTTTSITAPTAVSNVNNNIDTNSNSILRQQQQRYHQVNVLKLTQQLIDKRSAVAETVTAILLTLDDTTRRYYQLIKDYGGFTKLELPRRPKYEVVDINDVLSSFMTNSNNKKQQQQQSQPLLFEKNKILNINSDNNDSGNNKNSSATDKISSNPIIIKSATTKKSNNKNDSDADMFVIPMSSGYYYDGDNDNVMFL